MVGVSVHQPNFLPWIKLLAKVAASDVYVAYDSVQFTRNEFHARQRLKTRSGEAAWLSVPVMHTGRRQLLCDVAICESSDWRSKHLEFLQLNYGSARHFVEVFSVIEQVYDRRHSALVEHNLDLIGALCRYLNVDVRIVRSSTLPHMGDRTERLVQLVQETGGDVHLTSTSETLHLDWEQFYRAEMSVRMQEFTHPAYKQLHGSFMPGLSVVDLLFSHGIEAARMLSASSRFREISPSWRESQM
jgi:WbqC-like protein